LAFTEALLDANTTATVVIVDRHEKPGGIAHRWPKFAEFRIKDALRDLRDAQARMEKLIGTGRVRCFMGCNANMDGSMIAMVEDTTSWRVSVSQKVVDASFSRAVLPWERRAPFKIELGVNLLRPTDLPSATSRHPEYIVIGAGRTGVDAVLWLLAQGVPSEAVRWVMPRDPWLTIEGVHHMTEMTHVIAGMDDPAATAEDLFLAIEHVGSYRRLDAAVVPSMMHYTEVSPQDFLRLRRIKQIIRLGRVLEVTSSELRLERGCVPVSARALLVNCTNDCIQQAPPPVPIFEPRRITLQLVAECTPLSSNFAWCAGTIGVFEGLHPNKDDLKNQLLTPIRFFDRPIDFVKAMWIQCKPKADQRRLFGLTMAKAMLLPDSPWIELGKMDEGRGRIEKDGALCRWKKNIAPKIELYFATLEKIVANHEKIPSLTKELHFDMAQLLPGCKGATHKCLSPVFHSGHEQRHPAYALQHAAYECIREERSAGHLPSADSERNNVSSHEDEWDVLD